MKGKHVPIAILAFAAAAMLVLALFTKGWWTGQEEIDGEVQMSVAVGIFSYEECRRRGGYDDYRRDWDYDDDRRRDEEMRCSTQSFDDLGSDFRTWRRLGVLWVVGGVIAAASMVLLGVMALQRSSRRFPLAAYLGPVGFGALTMILWLAWNKVGADESHPSWGLFVALAAFLAAGAALWLRAYDAPPVLAAFAHPYAAMPQPIAPPAAAHPQHPCPRCLNPLEWVPQYGRWYCRACQQYP